MQYRLVHDSRGVQIIDGLRIAAIIGPRHCFFVSFFISVPSISEPAVAPLLWALKKARRQVMTTGVLFGECGFVRPSATSIHDVTDLLDGRPDSCHAPYLVYFLAER